MLAMDISLYGAFLYNYATAIDAVRTCSTHSIQFGEMSKDIRLLNGPTGTSVSLEDLLHKPVARVQKNTLVLNVSIDIENKKIKISKMIILNKKNTGSSQTHTN